MRRLTISLRTNSRRSGAARMNTAADLVERSVSNADLLRLSRHPLAANPYQQSPRTDHKRIRRHTRLWRIPDGQSCLNLAAARLRYIAGTAWSAKCYMNMRPLYQPHSANRSRRLIKYAKKSARYLR